MVQSEGLELGCVCPACGYRCKACLGTDSVVGREALKGLVHNEALMRDIFTSFEADDTPPETDPSPDKWGDEQWRD
jgi:hypothetical protein